MIIFNPISLYIHIPWCLKKCGYCDFYSYVSQETIPENEYVDNLLKDLEKDLSLIQNREINTIFIGGGTPSLLKSTSIKKLLSGIKERNIVSNFAEISMEANPKTLEHDSFINYKDAGINRFSLGVQTFNSVLLKNIERTYNFEEVTQSIIELKKNYANLNLDLMYGLPNQSLQDALLDLKLAIKYKPSHISWYQFTIEPNTNFYARKIQLPKEDIICNIFMKGDKLLQKSGYKKYEISSYAKLNYQCEHNLNYWNFGDYIGIGCGAHGKITQSDGNIIRTLKNKNIKDFLRGNYLNSTHVLSNKDKIFEYFMNALRLYQPVFKKHFTEKTNIQEIVIEKNIQAAIKEKFLINTSEYWDTTKKGKYFLNVLLEHFLN